MSTAPDPVTAYARAVCAGSVAVGRYHRLACERHLSDLARQGVAWPYVWRPEVADRFFRFAAKLKHYKGQWAGQPVVLQPHQQFRLGSVLGWLHRDTGLRRFRTAYNEIPRKNGKTFEAAIMALYATFFTGEPAANGYAIATKREQAKLVFGDMLKLVKHGGLVGRYFAKPQRGKLEHLTNDSTFEPLGKDADSTDGLNASVVIVDELHRHKDRDLVDVMRTSTGARREPLVFEITTAGSDRQSVCFEHHEYSQKILDGTFEDDTWFAFIASIDQGDRWDDEAAWHRANPNLGTSINIDVMRANADKARRVPADQNAFRRLYLNEWTEQEDRWIDMDDWRACGDDVPDDALAGQPCYIGLDLSSTTDLTACVALFPLEDGRIVTRCRFYLPQSRLSERAERKDRVPLDAWARQGYLTVTPGNVVDYDRVRSDLINDAAHYDVRVVAVDPWNARHLSQQLMGDGFNVVEVQQGFRSLTAPTKRLEEIVLSRRLAHGGNPVLGWCAGNVAVDTDPAGNLKVSKKRARERIDGVAALITGLALVPLSHQAEPDHPMLSAWG